MLYFVYSLLVSNAKARTWRASKNSRDLNLYAVLSWKLYDLGHSNVRFKNREAILRRLGECVFRSFFICYRVKSFSVSGNNVPQYLSIRPSVRYVSFLITVLYQLPPVFRYSLGSSPLQLWNKTARNGHIKRITDEEIQSLVIELVGSNVSTAYITCPPDPKKTLGIKLPYFVMVVKNLKKVCTPRLSKLLISFSTFRSKYRS